MGRSQETQFDLANASNCELMAALAAVLTIEVEQPLPQSEVGRKPQSELTVHAVLELLDNRLATNAA